MAEFRLPGGTDRTCVIGMTGSGKTIFGGWLLSRQRFDERPWVCIDFKDEILWDAVGDPPMRPLRLPNLPGKRGLYRLDVRPGDDEALESWLWKIWHRGNVGLFCDEVSLIPKENAFKALLRQGRSKRIPVIACTQRPVDCDREVFSEANFAAVFRLKDARDYKIVQQFSGNAEMAQALPPHWSHWYDAGKNTLTTLKPCPSPDMVAADLRKKVPYGWELLV
jgi:DNA helicase HerA-like ATPase